MIPKLGVDMTFVEAERAISDLVYRAGFNWTVQAVVNAARKLAGEKQAEAEREFNRIAAIEAAAGLKSEEFDVPVG